MTLLLSACSMSGEQVDQLLNQFEPTVEGALDLESPDTDDPVFTAVESSEVVLMGPQCQPGGLEPTASLQPDPSGITSVATRYPLTGELAYQETIHVYLESGSNAWINCHPSAGEVPGS